MNICLVNNLFPPINTGSSFYTYAVAKSLLKRGHNVVVITNRKDNERLIEYYKGIKVYRLPVLTLPKLELWMKFPDFNFSLFPKNFRRFEKILQREQIDIIHQCNNIFDLVFLSARFSKKLKIPLVCSLMSQVQHSNSIYNSILELFEKSIILPFFVKQVNSFIALDDECVRYISERFNRTKNVLFIPYMISEDDIATCIKYGKRDYTKTHYRMLSIGHVSKLKDRLELIKAWKIVIEKIPQAKMVIVGDIFSTKSQKLIQELNLENSIEFTGRIEQEEVFKLVETADFNAMFLSDGIPYHRGVGGANLEMMASGLPCLLDATDNFFGDKYEFISNQQFISATDRSPQYLADRCIELFQNPDLRKNIGKKGQTFVTETVTWDIIIREMESMYLENIAVKTND